METITIIYIVIAFVLGAIISFLLKRKGNDDDSRFSELKSENESLKTRLTAAENNAKTTSAESAKVGEEIKAKYENLFELTKDDLPEIQIERKCSQSTVSNTSYEDDKKCNGLNVLFSENNS